MRAGLPLAILLHILLFGAGYVVFPQAVDTFEDAAIIVPLDLVIPDETTNLAFSTTEKPKPVPTPEVKPEPTPEPEDPEPVEPEPEDDVTDAPIDEPDPSDEAEADPEEAPEPEPEAPEPEPTPEPTPTPEPPKPTPTPTPTKKADAPPAPNKSLLERALKTANDSKRERTSDRKAREAADLKAVEDANRIERTAGDRMRDTATWTALLKSKIETRCFRDAADMANSERLRATYVVTFNRDGTLRRPPRRTKPAQIPQHDPQMRVFDINAQRAIEKCAPYDDIFPPELYEEWKDFTFIFGK